MTPPGDGRRVLLIEDAEEVRLLLELVLASDGFEVSAAGDGPAGLAAAREQAPDVVLLDVQLPGLDGPEVLRELRRTPATAAVPVVFLTAEPPSSHPALEALGARGVLRKPFAVDTLGAQLAALL